MPFRFLMLLVGALLVGSQSIRFGEYLSPLLEGSVPLYPWLTQAGLGAIRAASQLAFYFAIALTAFLAVWGFIDPWRHRAPYFGRGRIFLTLIALAAAGYSFGLVVKPYAAYSGHLSQWLGHYPESIAFWLMTAPTLFGLFNMLREVAQATRDYEDRQGASPIMELRVELAAMSQRFGSHEATVKRLENMGEALLIQQGYIKNEHGKMSPPPTTENQKLSTILEALGVTLDREKKVWNQPKTSLHAQLGEVRQLLKQGGNAELEGKVDDLQNDIDRLCEAVGWTFDKAKDQWRSPEKTLRARLDELDHTLAKSGSDQIIAEFNKAMDAVFAMLRQLESRTAKTHHFLTNGHGGDHDEHQQRQG